MKDQVNNPTVIDYSRNAMRTHVVMSIFITCCVAFFLVLHYKVILEFSPIVLPKEKLYNPLNMTVPSGMFDQYGRVIGCFVLVAACFLFIVPDKRIGTTFCFIAGYGVLGIALGTFIVAAGSVAPHLHNFHKYAIVPIAAIVWAATVWVEFHPPISKQAKTS